MPAAVLTARPARSPLGADSYRRQARRLRGTLRGQPARLHRKLRELANRHDAGALPASGPSPVQMYDSPTVGAQNRGARAFAEEVAARMDGPVLRHSQRRALLGMAGRAGLGRFEANLIIAAVRHRRVAELAELVPAPATEPGRAWSLAPLLVVLAVESAVALGLWRVYFA